MGETKLFLTAYCLFPHKLQARICCTQRAELLAIWSNIKTLNCRDFFSKSITRQKNGRSWSNIWTSTKFMQLKTRRSLISNCAAPFERASTYNSEIILSRYKNHHVFFVVPAVDEKPTHLQPSIVRSDQWSEQRTHSLRKNWYIITLIVRVYIGTAFLSINK